MIAVIQRVGQASVSVECQCIAKIGHGLMVLVGVAKNDTEADVQFMVEKIPQLRIFADNQGHMNRSLQESHGELLLVSQFTLLANITKGRRPSFEWAASPEEAYKLYQNMLEQFQILGISVQSGRFGASMVINLENDGPVTLILDSRDKNKGKKVKEVAP